MQLFLFRALLLSLASASLLACAESARLPPEAGYGPSPILPSPVTTLFPTFLITHPKGWLPGATPQAAPGFSVRPYATGLQHPRWMYVLPNGDVLVAETNAPPRPDHDKGIKGWIVNAFTTTVGAGDPSANRITLLRDSDGDGIPETRTTFLEGLNSPFGMALVDNRFYVANTDAIISYPYNVGELQILSPGTKLIDLPAGAINHHWTRDLLASRRGDKLYVSVGSNSNVLENGIEVEEDRAAIHEVERLTGRSRIFASGLRNPIGLSWQPQSGALWAAVSERDELGSDLVPDYMTSIKDGGFYGWPYSYFGSHVDARVTPQRPDLVARAIRPDFALGAHTSSLGLTFYDRKLFPHRFSGGAFVGQHGSWNRNPRSGYKVIFVPFSNGKPTGPVEEVLTGFLSDDGDARGRPVGVVIDKSGALLVADDLGNSIWRVTPAN